MTPAHRQTARIMRIADATGIRPRVLDVDPETFKVLLGELTVLGRSHNEEVQPLVSEGLGQLDLEAAGGWVRIVRLGPLS